MPAPAAEEVRYQLLRPAQVIARRQACPVAYIPLGNVEWHGLHSPLGTDTLRAEGLAVLCARTGGGLAFPPLCYGDNRLEALMEATARDRAAIAAAMELPAENFTPPCQPFSPLEQSLNYQRLLLHILAEAESLGFELAVFIAGHAPLIDHARAAALLQNQRSRGRPGGMLAWACVDHVLVKGRYPMAGDHGAGWETSHLLALCPETVDLSRLPPRGTPLVGVGGKMPPQQATAEFGREVLAAAAAVIVREVRHRLAHQKQYLAHGRSFAEGLWREEPPALPEEATPEAGVGDRPPPAARRPSADEVRYLMLRPAEALARRKACPVAYVPLGNVEWHGPQNPLGTDGLRAEGLAMLCAQTGGGLAFPPLWYGENRLECLVESTAKDRDEIAAAMELPAENFTPERQPFTQTEQTLNYQKLLLHILAELESLGFELGVLVAGHGPLIDHARAAVLLHNQRCRSRQAGMLAWALDHGLIRDRHPGAVDHGAGGETSQNLALHPETVDLSVLPPKGGKIVHVVGPIAPQDATAEFGRTTLAANAELAVREVRHRLAHPKQYLAHGRGLIEGRWREDEKKV